MINEITVIILTYNEEEIIGRVLESIKNITQNIFVVDSYSTDNTLAILNEMNIHFVQHNFDNYSKQRNWAQYNNPYETEWVLHLDADEPITHNLKVWLLNEFNLNSKKYDGFMFSRKAIFMGRWLKYGGQYPNYHLRLFKSDLGKCENKEYDQHFIVSGRVLKVVNAEIYNTISANLQDFIISHEKWATKEAIDIIFSQNRGNVKVSLLGNPIERKRWLKKNVFEKSPLFFRSFLYFIYRYFIRFGFLDGKEGLIFYVLQSFWFRFIIDAKVFEIRNMQNQEEKLIHLS